MSIADGPKLKLGFEDYALFPDDGKRHEILDGNHFVNASPSTCHQTVSKRLQHHLYTKIELANLGLVFNAPIAVQLSEHDIVELDLVVLLNETEARITPSKIIGAPNLLIEILSPSTASKNKQLKRHIYERSGVSEYWIVDPEEATVMQLVLREGSYQEAPPNEELRPTILPEIAIGLSEIW